MGQFEPGLDRRGRGTERSRHVRGDTRRTALLHLQRSGGDGRAQPLYGTDRADAHAADVGAWLPFQRIRSGGRGAENRRCFREFKIPCDALYLDGGYTENQRAFTWDRERFPAPAVLIRELAEQGFKTVAVLYPAIKADAGYKVYESGTHDDIFLKMPDGQPFRRAGSEIGQTAFPDFTSAKARAWWAAQCEAFSKRDWRASPMTAIAM